MPPLNIYIGDVGSRQSDYFSLGVIAYQMLTGKLPYGTQVSKIRARAQQQKRKYISAQNYSPLASNVPVPVNLASFANQTPSKMPASSHRYKARRAFGS